MRRWQPINWIQWMTLLLALFMAFAFIALYLRIENVQKHQNDALRAIICRAEHVVRTQPDIPEKQRHDAIRFYRQSLAGAHLKPCP